LATNFAIRLGEKSFKPQTPAAHFDGVALEQTIETKKGRADVFSNVALAFQNHFCSEKSTSASLVYVHHR